MKMPRREGSGSDGSNSSAAPAASTDGRRRHGLYRNQVKRRLRRSLVIAALFAVAAGYGLWGDDSIRRDPFTGRPGFVQWMTTGQPHPALARIPVVPIGALGSLTHRPADTAWLGSPLFPDVAAPEPPAAAAFTPTLLRSAIAEEPSKIDKGADPRGSPRTTLTKKQAPPVEQQIPPSEASKEPREVALERAPNLVGYSFTRALALARRTRFKLVHAGEVASSRDPGTIVRQSPPPGSPLLGLGIRVWVAAAPAKTKEPADMVQQTGTAEQSRVARTSPPRILDAWFAPDGEIGFIVGEGRRSLKTTDGGASWQPFLRDGYESAGEDLLALYVNPELTNVVVLSERSVIVEDANGNPSDVQSEILSTRGNMPLERIPVDGEPGIVYSSPKRDRSGGLEWLVWNDRTGLHSRVVDPRADGLRAGVGSPAGDRGWFVGADGKVAVIDQPPHIAGDYGMAAVSNDQAAGNVHAHVVGEPSVAVGDGGILLVRAREGEGWKQQPSPTAANLRSLYVVPGETPGETIAWATSGFDDGNAESERPVILQTLDGGRTWERLAYRYLPAPWVIYLALPGLVFAGYFLVMAVIDMRNAPAPREAIDDTAVTDAPIGWEDGDVLGMKPIARALSKFLRNPNTDPPLTFAITGRWGTGKSSLMNLLAEDLRHFDCRPVWFNAWHHQKEQHLLAALLENIRAQSIPAWWRYSGLEFRLRLLFVRSGSLLKGTLALGLVVGAVLLISQLLFERGEMAAALEHLRSLTIAELPSETTVPGVAKGLASFGVLGAILWGAAATLLKLRVISLNPAKLMASLSERASVGALRDQLDFRHRFAEEFGEVCRALRTHGRAGMVIMIDDLDRCRPDNVLDVLEAVNFLVTAGPCFVILGIDDEKVTNCVAYGFKNAILKLPQPGEAPLPDGDSLEPDAVELAEFSRHYLEKLINITVPVPAATDLASKRLLGATEDEETEEEPISPWPRRARGWLRNAVDLTFGLVPLTVVTFLVVFSVTRGLGPAALPAGSADEITTSPAASAPAGGAADSVKGGATASSAAEGRTGPAILQISPEDLRAGQPWMLYAVLGATVAMVGLLALARMTVDREAEIEDKPEFLRALAICNEAIFAANPTPRGVKRFQNRLRYFAMYARGEDRELDWIDHVFEHLGHRVDTDRDAGKSKVEIPEATLVGLGTVQAFGAGANTKRWHEIWLGLSRGTGDGALPDPLRGPLTDLKNQFPREWPPSPSQVQAFTTLSQTIRD